MLELWQRSVGLFTHVENLNNTLATSRTDVECLNEEFRTICDELTAMRAEVTPGVNIQEVQ